MSSISRTEVCNALEALFEADTTLYGPVALINNITSNMLLYENARVSIDTPYKMFLNATTRSKIAVRASGNVDYSFTINYRIEGLRSNPQTAKENIDAIDERIEYLCDNEMWSGTNLSSQYTNASCTVLNIEWEESNVNMTSDEGGIKVECEGSIVIDINYIKE